MIEAYAIGVNIMMAGNLSAVIAQVSKEFGALDTTIKNVQISVNELAASMRGLQRIGVSAAAAWSNAAASMERASRAARTAANGNVAQPMAATGTNGGGGFGPRALPYVAAAALGYGGGAATGGGGRGGGGGNIPRLPGSGGGIPIFPTGGGGGGSGRVPLTGHDMAMGALGFSAVGAGIGAAESNMFTDAAELGAVQARMKMAGFTDAQIAASMAAARAQTAAIPGLTLSGALHTILDVRTMTGSADAGISAMPEFAKLGLVLGAEGKGDDVSELYAAIQAGELRGAIVDPKTHEIDIAKLTGFVKNVQAAAIATGFRFGPRQILQTLKSGGISASALSDQALFADQVLPSLTLGAAGGGTALQGFGMQFAAGKMSEAAARMLEEMGLLDLRGEPLNKYKTGLGQFNLPPSVLKGRDMAAAQPANFILDTLLPGIDNYLRAHDVEVNQQNEMIAAQQLASRIPGGKYMADFIRLRPIVERERQNFEAAQGRDAYKMRVESDPRLATQAFNASFHNMMAELGSAFMKDAIAAMQLVTNAMQALGKWAADHPDTARRILDVAGALGMLSTAIGVVAGALFVAGPMLKVLGAAASTVSGFSLSGAVAGLRAGSGGGIPGLVAGAAVGLVAGYLGLKLGDDASERGKAFDAAHPYSSFTGPDAFYNYAPWKRQFWLNGNDGLRGSPTGGMSQNNGPTPVVVVNTGELSNATSTSAISRITQALSGPRSGSTSNDYRVSPYANALQVP